MIRNTLLALFALSLFACSKGGEEKLEVKGDRPGQTGCADCLTRISSGGVMLDTDKLDAAGATLTGARLELAAGSSQAVTLKVGPDGLGKADLALAEKLDGMPAATDCKAWGGASANLAVDYETAKGEKGSVTMKVPMKVQDCP